MCVGNKWHRERDAARYGVNFTNILRAAFTGADPKSAIKLLNLTVFFALLGSARVKAACRTLVKLTPVVDGIVDEDIEIGNAHLGVVADEGPPERVDLWRAGQFRSCWKVFIRACCSAVDSCACNSCCRSHFS